MTHILYMVFLYVPVISHPTTPQPTHGHCVLIDFFIYLSAQCAATLQYIGLAHLYISRRTAFPPALNSPTAKNPKPKQCTWLEG